MDHELYTDFAKIIESSDDSEITLLTKLFLEQKKKGLFSRSATGLRFHLMITDPFSFVTKSPSCHEDIPNSKV